MKINNSINPTWRQAFSSPQQVKASEEGLFKPITAKVSEALSTYARKLPALDGPHSSRNKRSQLKASGPWW